MMAIGTKRFPAPFRFLPKGENISSVSFPGRKVGMNAKFLNLRYKFVLGDRNPLIEGLADYENLARLI